MAGSEVGFRIYTGLSDNKFPCQISGFYQIDSVACGNFCNITSGGIISFRV